jgi:hypothetical protein
LTQGTSSFANFAWTASWVSDLYPQTYQASGSWASSSLSSSRAVSAANADNATNATNAGTASLTQGTSSYADWAKTASYALNGTGQQAATGVTQSWYDIPVREMAVPDSGGLTEVQTTSVVHKYVNSFQSYYYLQFPSRDGGGIHDWGYGTHVFRLPFNFSGSLTHSFQYIDTGDQALGGNGEIPNSVTSSKAYWEVKLYAVTSSNSPTASFLNAPALVEKKVITQSLIGGNPASSGSVWSTSSYFNDPNGYLTNNSLIILNLIRVSTVEVGSGGDMSDYSASLGLVSSQYRWISS